MELSLSGRLFVRYKQENREIISDAAELLKLTQPVAWGPGEKDREVTLFMIFE